MIRSNDTADVICSVFRDCLTGVIIPNFDTTRETMKLQNVAGILLCDNSSSHIDEQVKQLLAEPNIRLIAFPPHPAHLFQLVPLVAFAAV
jgi:hypothetical protein